MDCTPKVRVAILDSGAYASHPNLRGAKLEGCTLKYDEHTQTVFEESDYVDEVGHGTAIASIIHTIVPDAKLYIYKVLDTNLTIEPFALVKILTYISQHDSYDLINLSMGITECDYLQELREICEEISQKGTIIVSAFDNDNTISFPAEFSHVIGVDTSFECRKMDEWEYVENSIVNLRGIGSMQRIAWRDPEYVVTCGSSMTCACITGQAARFLMEGARTREDVLQAFQSRAKRTYASTPGDTPVSKRLPRWCGRAALFPLNKETHAICRYPDLTCFDLTAVYDVRLSGHLGRTIRECTGAEHAPELMVKNVQNIDYDGFDLLVVGHYQTLIRVMKQQDFIQDIINKTLALGKRVFLFDPPKDDKLKNHPLVFYPQIDFHFNICNRFQKLYHISKPVLGIVGTSSKQGKFSFQLELRRRFLADGYRLGALGTEPHAELFGFDETFACGYNSAFGMSIEKMVSVVNQLMWNIASDNPDIIMVGSQAGLIPDNIGDLSTYPLTHQIFLQAVRPDALFLCVNPDDTLKRIENCIKTAEGLSGGKVIGLVCFPRILDRRWKGDLYHYVSISNNEVERLKKLYQETFFLPTFVLGDMPDMDRAYQQCIDFFAQ